MKSFFAAAAVSFLLSLSSAASADDPITLPTIPVVGNPCGYAFTCVYGRGMSAFLVPIPAPPSPLIPIASVSPEDYSLIATCQSLRDRARQTGCNTNDPPPAPYFPSPTRGQWVSNGCGSGSWSQKFGQFIGYIGVDGFTGDLDEPLAGFSFASACAGHDSCYYTGYKSGCDLRFGAALADVCGTIKACLDIAADYQSAVLLAGQSAYDNDHRDMECAKIAKTLRDGDCAS